MRKLAVVVAAALFAAGCGPDQGAPGVAGNGDVDVQQAAAADQLAGWMAGAMAEPGFRGVILQAMRESPLSEHALPLSALLDGQDGAQVLAALSRASGRTPAEVREVVASLPPLDFYVPAQRDRLGWDGGADLVVAAMPGRNAPTIGFTPTHTEVALDLASGQPEAALFMLQFSEHKAYRLEPQPQVAGARIQDPADGELAAALVFRTSEGGERVIQVRDLPAGIQLAQYCPPDIPGCPPADDGGGGGGNGDPSPPQPGTGQTYLAGLQTIGECDNSNCAEGNEFEFRATSTYSSATMRWEGVSSSGTYSNLQKVIVPYTPSSYVSIKIGLYETDGWPNPDDHFVYVNAQGGVGDPVLVTDPTPNNPSSYPLKKYANVGSNDPVKMVVVYAWQ